jgi:hypothetical protein
MYNLPRLFLPFIISARSPPKWSPTVEISSAAEACLVSFPVPVIVWISSDGIPHGGLNLIDQRDFSGIIGRMASAGHLHRWGLRQSLAVQPDRTLPDSD